MKVIVFKKNVFNALYSIFAILSCVALGRVCAFYAPLLPSSLYGLIIFTFALHFQLFKADKIKSSVIWCIKNMAVCFVPAGVGIMNHFELVKQFGITIVAITFLTTFLLLTLVGLHYQRYADSDA